MTAMPKWDEIEEALLSKGIIPEPIRDEWEKRARNFFLAHGSEYDDETGDLVCSDGIKIPRETWLKVVKEIKEGKTKFRADREKDLLTKVLGNPKKEDEHEALALVIPGRLGFPKTKILIEADREQRSDGRRREIGSTSC